MSASATCLLGLTAWSVFLLVYMFGLRVVAMVAEGKAINSFLPDGTDMQPAGRRATRAHANSLEGLPIAGALLLYAIATGQTALTDPLAMVVLGARVLQSVTHLVSVSKGAVLVRATLFTVQVLIWVFWAWRLYAAGG